MAVVLIGGGARSGKSRYALDLARQRGTRRAFVATAQAFDAEMEQRIAHHRAERGGEFETFEAPLELAAVIAATAGAHDVVVVDCLTLWLTNVMLAGNDVEAAVEALVREAAAAPSWVLLVTNEVGCGIVPEHALARRFRDEAGRLHQRVAAVAAEVYWMVFGCALRVR